MITCKPTSLFSWNYLLQGETPDETATVEFNWFSEQGTITAGPEVYTVAKLGVFSGTWQLEQGHAVLAVARKPNAFTRRFEIEYGPRTGIPEAVSAFSNAMQFIAPNHGGGTISPAHWFSRRATLDIAGVPFPIQCFLFWLTALTWKRSSESHSAAT